MKTSFLKAVVCTVLAAASIACLAGCPERPGNGGTIQENSQQGQQNAQPKQTVQSAPAK
jgi:hypothetical protein